MNLSFFLLCCCPFCAASENQILIIVQLILVHRISFCLFTYDDVDDNDEFLSIVPFPKIKEKRVSVPPINIQSMSLAFYNFSSLMRLIFRLNSAGTSLKKCNKVESDCM